VTSPILIGAKGERAKATQIAVARIAIGAGALLTPGLARVLFGLPKKQDVPAARTMGGLFGIRNIVLGSWTLIARDRDVGQRRLCYGLNAVVDAADVGVLLWPLARRQGLDRFAISSLALAISATWAWLELLEESEAAAVTEISNTR
jgi:hypothetical protein